MRRTLHRSLTDGRGAATVASELHTNRNAASSQQPELKAPAHDRLPITEMPGPQTRG
jgi:hypothetical protein